MKISFVIVNHNTSAILKECLESIFRYEDKSDLEIIIVDNASRDDTADQLINNIQNVKLISLKEKVSFSAANNLGIKKSSSPFLVIMNPDIIFTEPVIRKLISVFESDKLAGAVSPALIGNDGQFQRNYFQRYPSVRQFVFYYSVLAKFFNKSAKRMDRYLENQKIDIKTKEIFQTEQLPCAFFLTKKSIIEEIGYMDENFMLFFEDVDLSYRIAKKYKLIVDTSVKVKHIGGASFKSTDNWKLYGRFIISMIYFFRKHYSPLRTLSLIILVTLNSYLILFIEHLRFRKKNKIRILKHRYMLKLLNQSDNSNNT